MGLILLEPTGCRKRDRERIAGLPGDFLDRGHRMALVRSADGLAQPEDGVPGREDRMVSSLALPTEGSAMRSLLGSHDDWVGFLPGTAEFVAPSLSPEMDSDRWLRPWGIKASLPPRQRQVSEDPVAGWLMSPGLAASVVGAARSAADLRLPAAIETIRGLGLPTRWLSARVQTGASDISRESGERPAIGPDASVLAVVPHYKCEAWLGQCLASLIDQTRAHPRLYAVAHFAGCRSGQRFG